MEARYYSLSIPFGIYRVKNSSKCCSGYNFQSLLGFIIEKIELFEQEVISNLSIPFGIYQSTMKASHVALRAFQSLLGFIIYVNYKDHMGLSRT